MRIIRISNHMIAHLCTKWVPLIKVLWAKYISSKGSHVKCLVQLLDPGIQHLCNKLLAFAKYFWQIIFLWNPLGETKDKMTTKISHLLIVSLHI